MQTTTASGASGAYHVVINETQRLLRFSKKTHQHQRQPASLPCKQLNFLVAKLLQHKQVSVKLGTTLVAVQAQPVKVGQPVAIQPSNAPLTVPDAPRLALHERSASRQAFDAAVAQKQKQAEVRFMTSCSTAFHPGFELVLL